MYLMRFLLNLFALSIVLERTRNSKTGTLLCHSYTLILFAGQMWSEPTADESVSVASTGLWPPPTWMRRAAARTPSSTSYSLRNGTMLRLITLLKRSGFIPSGLHLFNIERLPLLINELIDESDINPVVNWKSMVAWRSYCNCKVTLCTCFSNETCLLN